VKKTNYRELWRQLTAVLQFGRRSRYSSLELLALMSQLETEHVLNREIDRCKSEKPGS